MTRQYLDYVDRMLLSVGWVLASETLKDLKKHTNQELIRSSVSLVVERFNNNGKLNHMMTYEEYISYKRDEKLKKLCQN